jgi:carboxypeptidase T
MLKKLLIILFILPSSLLVAQNYARCKVLLQGRPIAELTTLGIETDHGELAEKRHFITDLSRKEIEMIQNAGFSTEILIPDVQQWYVDQNKPTSAPTPDNGAAFCDGGGTVNFGNYPLPVNMTTGSMGGYYTYAEMLAILDSMHARFPQFISSRKTISDTLLTHEGRPLWWVRISDNPEQDENEPEALYNALHHAREPLGLTQLIRFMWYLMENYDNDASIKAIIENTELYFVPCINPDGYVFNETTNPDGGGLWRKNRRDNGNGQYGVDLNRNYGYQWGYNNQGSSPNPGSDTYRGPSAFSEPETRLMRDFCLQHQFVNAFNYHTFGNLLIYPFGYSDATAEPYLPYLAQSLTAKNNYRPGTTSQTVGYAVNGTSDDWMYAEKDIFSYTPESGPGSLGFWPPANLIDSLSAGTQYMNLMLAWSLLDLVLAEDRSGGTTSTTTFTVPVSLTNVSADQSSCTVSLNQFDPNVVEITPASYNVTLGVMETQNVEFTVKINPNLSNLSSFQYGIDVNNGLYTRSDTISKVFLKGAAVVVFNDQTAPETSWTGDWQTTTSTWFSAPTCITDSEQSDYNNNTVTICQGADPISLPANAVLPKLEFKAKWAIENDYDWVQLDAVTANSIYQLCGKFSQPGSANQTPNQPVWDGVQLDWVSEEVSLEQLKGTTFNLYFSLYSDGAVNDDGFYFDDLVVSYIDTTNSSGVEDALLLGGDFGIQPTVTANEVTVSWGKSFPQDVYFVVTNALGQEILESKLTGAGQQAVSVQSVPTGVFYAYVQTNQGKTPAKRLVIVR